MSLLDMPLQRDTQALYRIFTAVSSSLDIECIANALVEHTVVELGYDAATLHLLDAEQGALRFRAAYEARRPAQHPQPVGKRHRQGRQAQIPDVVPVTVSKGRREPVAAMIAVPLALRHRSLGVLRVYTVPPRAPDEQERTLLEAVATFGAAAIERADHAAALQEIAAGLMGNLDLKAVLRAFLAQTVRALGAPAGSLWLLDSTRQQLNFAAAHGLSRAYTDRSAVRVAEDRVSNYILSRTEPVALTELCEGDDLPYPEEAQREGMRGILVAPLRLRGAGFGVLRIYTSELRRFSTQELAFAGRAVELGARAIDNARRHEERKVHLVADSSVWRRLLKRK